MALLVLGASLGTKLILTSRHAATSKRQVESTGPMQVARHGQPATVLRTAAC